MVDKNHSVDRLKTLFEYLDRNKDNRLSKEELQHAFRNASDRQFHLFVSNLLTNKFLILTQFSCF